MILTIFIAYLLVVYLFSLKQKIRVEVFYINCIFILTLIGLRGYNIGSIDTMNYVKYFVGKQSYYNNDSREIEIGFVIYNNFLSGFIKYGWLYLLFNAVFSLLPLFYLIKRYSKNIHLSLLLFFLAIGGVHVVYFVCSRQVIATAFVLWGIVLFLRNVKYKYVVLISLAIIGSFIHTSAYLILFAFIFLNKINISRNVYALLAISSFIIGYSGMISGFEVFKSYFMYLNFAVGRLSNYMDYSFEEKRAYLYPFFRTIFAILLAYKVKDSFFKSIFTKMFLVAVILGNLFVLFEEIYRLVGLFSIFGLVSITYIDFSTSYSKINNFFKYFFSKKLVNVLFLLIILYSFYKFSEGNYLRDMKIESDNSTIVPYKFTWDDKYQF